MDCTRHGWSNGFVSVGNRDSFESDSVLATVSRGVSSFEVLARGIPCGGSI